MGQIVHLKEREGELKACVCMLSVRKPDREVIKGEELGIGSVVETRRSSWTLTHKLPSSDRPGDMSSNSAFERATITTTTTTPKGYPLMFVYEMWQKGCQPM